MKKTAIILMIITVFSKFLGLLRDIILSYFYGTSLISDAYLIALMIPTIIFGFVAKGISTGFIPIYREIEQRKNWNEGNEFTNIITNILLIFSTIVALTGLLYTEELVKVFASGFEGETLILASNFTRVSIIGVYFIGLTALFSSYLQIHNYYAITSMIGFPLNIITITAIYLSYNYNIMYLPFGILLGLFSQFILFIPFVYKAGFKYRVTVNFNNEYVKKLIKMVIPVLLGVSINQINLIIDRTLASQITIGGISSLNFSYQLIGFVQGIVVVSIATAMYPIISKLYVKKDWDILKHTVRDSIGGIIVLLVPATLGYVFFSKPIISLLYGRGAFGVDAIAMTSNALVFYSIGIVGYGLREILSRVFYSMNDSKTPMINGAYAVILNIILNLILSRFLGIGGLALATSISALFCSLLLLINLRRKVGKLYWKELIVSFIKIIISSLIMIIITQKVLNFLMDFLNPNLSLIITLILGFLIYLIIIIIMKVKEAEVIIKFIRRNEK